jgi:glycine/D-amino acid oxidase-like deaminating enzyme
MVPAQARVVVIGGGVAGCSVAYHLALLGWDDVVVLEQHELGEGTSWHSAGFVGQLRSTVSQTRMIMYSAELYERLGAETGLDPGWRRVGGLRIAAGDERVSELKRARSMALATALELELVSAAEATELVPMLDATNIRAAAWIPGDGYLDPELLVAALSHAARSRGVQIHTGVRVQGLDVADGRICGVQTDQGAIGAELVVNAAGAAAGVVARLADAHVPVVPMRHQYALTEPIEGVGPEMPTVRDPDRIVYFRPKDGGLLVGGYAREPITEPLDDPLTRPRTLYQEDRARFAESWAGAQALLPVLRGTEPGRFICGPEAFTPDGEFVLGETEVDGLWVAAGFCVHGLAGAGGVGRLGRTVLVAGDSRRVSSHPRSRGPV